jgi:hypothetical protein
MRDDYSDVDASEVLSLQAAILPARARALPVVVRLLAAAPLLAGFVGTDLFLPNVDWIGGPTPLTPRRPERDAQRMKPRSSILAVREETQ